MSSVRCFLSLTDKNCDRYAAMKSAIGRGPKHNIWVGSAWGGFFEIDWQLQYDFPFNRFEHLSNPLNEGETFRLLPMSCK